MSDIVYSDVPPEPTPGEDFRICKFCKFYHSRPGANTCRVRSPYPSGFPSVQWHDWCGSWQSHDKAIEKEMDNRTKEANRKLNNGRDWHEHP